MAETPILQAEVRTKVGSKEAVKLRKANRIPAIVYGHGKDPVAISLDMHDFVEGLHHGHRFFEVQFGKKKESLLVKDLQYDHLGKYVIHADLVRVSLTEAVKVMVPLELKGTARGAEEGGMIDSHLNEIEVECKVDSIPEKLIVSIKEIDVGDSIHAGEIGLPAGVTLVTDPDALVLTCHLVAAAKTTEELEEEQPLVPEVITEKDQEDEQAAQGDKGK